MKALVTSENAEESDVQKLTFNLEETYPNSRSQSTHSATVLLPGESKLVTLVNSLTHDRTQLVGIKVRTVKVMVSHVCQSLSLSVLIELLFCRLRIQTMSLYPVKSTQC